MRHPPTKPLASLGIALIAATVATTVNARPVWQYVERGLIHGEPSSGEAYYPGISCAAGRLTITLIPSHDAGLHQNRDLDWLDARGHAGPWPLRMIVRSGALSMTVPGELTAENFGFPEAEAQVPASSGIGRAILATGVVDASARGTSMHVPPIPRPLLARLAADCRGRVRR